jgi:tRNA(adenine34) deaminase
MSNFDPAIFDDAMMRRALELADIAAKQGEVPVGAVVFDHVSGVVLAEGFNTRETTKEPHAHAEFLAIMRACQTRGDWRLNDCSLAVTLEPCPMCAGLIVNARVGRVIYGATDPKAGAVETLHQLLSDTRLNHRPVVIGGVLAAEASAALKTFFKALRSEG